MIERACKSSADLTLHLSGCKMTASSLYFRRTVAASAPGGSCTPKNPQQVTALVCSNDTRQSGLGLVMASEGMQPDSTAQIQI